MADHTGDSLEQALDLIVRSLHQQAALDEPLRSALGTLGAALVRVAGAPALVEPRPGLIPPSATRRAVPTTFSPPTQDLSLVVRRSRLKALSCRWCVSRLENPPRTRARATLMNRSRLRLLDLGGDEQECYLPMLDPYNRAALDTPDRLALLASCYETLALAAMVCRALIDRRAGDEMVRLGLQWLATAQSAVRVAAREAGVERDSDHELAYEWLSSAAAIRALYVHRHMRLDDPADPNLWAQTRSFLLELMEKLDAQEGTPARAQILSGVRARALPVATAGWWEENEEGWTLLADALSGALAAGLAHDDVSLHELILPLLELMPGSVNRLPHVRTIVRAIDERLARAEAVSTVPSPPTHVGQRAAQGIAAVQEADVLLVAGRPRLRWALALERDLLRGTGSLRWLDGAESLEGLDRAIAQATLVLHSPAWSGLDPMEMRRRCAAIGTPCVTIGASFTLPAVAAPIAEQYAPPPPGAHAGVHAGEPEARPEPVVTARGGADPAPLNTGGESEEQARPGP